MKCALNNVNIITKAKESMTDCQNCCFFHKRDVCFNTELRYHYICYDCHTLDVNIDDIFKL